MTRYARNLGDMAPLPPGYPYANTSGALALLLSTASASCVTYEAFAMETANMHSGETDVARLFAALRLLHCQKALKKTLCCLNRLARFKSSIASIDLVLLESTRAV